MSSDGDRLLGRQVYVDLDEDESVLDGRFTATELRLVADEMDREADSPRPIGIYVTYPKGAQEVLADRNGVPFGTLRLNQFCVVCNKELDDTVGDIFYHGGNYYCESHALESRRDLSKEKEVRQCQ